MRRMIVLLSLCGFLQVLAINTPYAQSKSLSVCDPGDAIQLMTIEGAFAYSWSPATSLDNPTIFNPVAKPLEETTYVVQIIPAIASENLIENPDFTEGNEGFTSDYPFVSSISQQGVYGINTSAKNLNGIFFSDCPDHTDGTGNMMVIDGSPVANEEVWCQSITVSTEKSYAFSTWLTSVNDQNPAMLKFSINGQALGSVFSASRNVCEWRQFYEIWESESNTTAEICIINQNTNPAGNDFALDDFAFYELDTIIYDTCTVEVQSLSAASDRLVYIPNAFSPNDDGFNDLFQILIGKGVSRVDELNIYDGWGNLVFKSANCMDGENCSWDGRVGNAEASVGTYVYNALITFANGEKERYASSLLLTR